MMEFFYFMVTLLATVYFLRMMDAIACELRDMRAVLEAHYELEPAPVRAQNKYKRKGVEL